MNAVYPVRATAHQLEERSRRFLVGNLPGNWAHETLAHDYGVDLKIDIFEGQIPIFEVT